MSGSLTAVAPFGTSDFAPVGFTVNRPTFRAKSLKRGTECRLSNSWSTVRKVRSMDRSALRLFEHLQSLRLVTKTDINFGKLGK